MCRRLPPYLRESNLRGGGDGDMGFNESYYPRKRLDEENEKREQGRSLKKKARAIKVGEDLS